MDVIVKLEDAHTGFGGKAGNLAAMIAGGFDVPDGFAIGPDAALDDLPAHLDALGEIAVAVRSSAMDEDGADSSFAGIYDSIVDVRGAADVEEAVAAVRASAHSDRALAYRDDAEPVRMGVVVQRLVRADCAGVMFTADPVTGDRNARLVTAVHGLGEGLVSGDEPGEEWSMRDGRLVRRRTLPEPVLSEALVRELIALGERVAAHFGKPQDIEWVLEGGRLSLVQARPITALPDIVEWRPPSEKGSWNRNFRWGEWLGDPVSPLFATWFLPVATGTFDHANFQMWGVRPPPPTYGLVNGWYYASPVGAGGTGTLLGGLLRRPRAMVGAMRAGANPLDAAPWFADPHLQTYEDELTPRHRALADEQPADDPAALIDYVDRACALHGKLMFSFTLVGGFAWKLESALATFFRTHCEGIEGAPHELLAVLAPVEPSAAHHGTSLDWLHPTAGELGLAGTTTPVNADAASRREELERACLETLTTRNCVRFERLLEAARRYAQVRESQAHDLTLAWPAVRRALRQIGDRAAGGGAIEHTDDVFWLHRDELEDALTGDGSFQSTVAARRARWQRQRRLAAPLVLTELPGPMRKLQDSLVAQLRGDDVEQDGASIIGMPASAGRATGRVRLVLSPSDFDRLQEGEVLVAPATSPAWTPLFTRAVAVITDGGSVAAHASLVAREYGIPAVIGTGEATQQLHDGQLVVVDGTRGRVELLTGP